MEEAVQTADQITKPGDIVTLSPACASFDKYPNFEERGMHYKRLVNRIAAETDCHSRRFWSGSGRQ